jgi:hypothetical protein
LPGIAVHFPGLTPDAVLPVRLSTLDCFPSPAIDVVTDASHFEAIALIHVELQRIAVRAQW